MFASVWNTLAQKKCVAIFPEGGSHDQSNFLPFKAGVSIMSLGFLDHYPDSEFYLIPVGMNYFKRDSFREYSFLFSSLSHSQSARFSGYRRAHRGGSRAGAAIPSRRRGEVRGCERTAQLHQPKHVQRHDDGVGLDHAQRGKAKKRRMIRR